MLVPRSIVLLTGLIINIGWMNAEHWNIMVFIICLIMCIHFSFICIKNKCKKFILWGPGNEFYWNDPGLMETYQPLRSSVTGICAAEESIYHFTPTVFCAVLFCSVLVCSVLFCVYFNALYGRLRIFFIFVWFVNYIKKCCQTGNSKSVIFNLLNVLTNLII